VATLALAVLELAVPSLPMLVGYFLLLLDK
jgi:hypothetical protein